MQLVEVEVMRLGLDRSTNSYVVILQEKGGARLLPIWIGQPEAESIVGLLINTLPLRVRVMDEMRVLDWLKELRAQNLAVQSASGEMLFFTDADTRTRPDTLKLLMENFVDPRIGLVTADVYLGQPGNAVAEGRGPLTADPSRL